MARGSRMTKKLKPGEKVSWNSAQGKVKGEVVRELTRTTRVKGHVAKATKEDPQYRVRSDNTGAEAAHKPGQLEKA